MLDGEIVVYNNEVGLIDFDLEQQRRDRFQEHRTAQREQPFKDAPVPISSVRPPAARAAS